MGLQVREELCVGCGLCELACAAEHFGEEIREMARLRIREEPSTAGTYRIVHCDQCGICVDLCPKGAIEIDALGHCRIAADRCTGCGNCAASCPRGAIFTHPSAGAPLKCTGCGACVQVCTGGALSGSFGSDGA